MSGHKRNFSWFWFSVKLSEHLCGHFDGIYPQVSCHAPSAVLSFLIAQISFELSVLPGGSCICEALVSL